MSEQPSSGHWQLQSIVTGLRGAREQWRTRNGRSSG
ncbi:serine acetyltransferase, partial [Pseudomonas plecoglossicida]